MTKAINAWAITFEDEICNSSTYPTRRAAQAAHIDGSNIEHIPPSATDADVEDMWKRWAEPEGYKLIPVSISPHSG